jgi:hypothetical protein
MVIHINDDLGEDESAPVDPNVILMLINSVAFATAN